MAATYATSARDAADVPTMRGLTIRQPWAACIVRGTKWIESRSWSTPYRGPILIHAGMRGDASADGLPRGAVVAWCQLVEIVPVEALAPWESRAQRSVCDLAPGRFAWRLADVTPLARPIAWRGALGLWTPTAALRAAVMRQLRAAQPRRRTRTDTPGRSRGSCR